MSTPIDGIRSNTVWCASYPKSGNTWVRSLAMALRTSQQPDINRLGAEGHAGADLMRSLGLSPSDMQPGSAHAFVRLGWAIGSGIDSDAPTLRKTHTPWLPLADGYPECWQPPDARAVYIVRDPRAVAVSWAHHIGHSHTDAVTIMETHKPGLAAHSGEEHHFHPGDWSVHVTSWMDQRDIPTLVIRYEDLTYEPQTTVRQLARWLDLPDDEQSVQAAVDACSFANLASAEIVNGFAEASAPDRVFFRRGEAEAWREELAEDLIERIETQHGEVMRRLGYLE